MCQQEKLSECQAANVSGRFYLAQASGTISRRLQQGSGNISKTIENQHGISVFPLSCITPTTKEKTGLQESLLRARFVGRFQQSATFWKVKAEMWFSQFSAA